MVDIIAGIYEDKITEIKRKIILVAPHVTTVQIDVSDGTFVTETSVVKAEDFIPVVKANPKITFEAHLMVNHPESYVTPFSRAGFKRLIAHIECEDVREFLNEAQYESVDTGIAIDAPTEFDLAEPYLEEVDFVLVMTAEAGASGQVLMPETLEKIKIIKERYPELPIEVDCGINDQTARAVIDSGATRLVVTSYLFKDEIHIFEAVNRIKQA